MYGPTPATTGGRRGEARTQHTTTGGPRSANRSLSMLKHRKAEVISKTLKKYGDVVLARAQRMLELLEKG